MPMQPGRMKERKKPKEETRRDEHPWRGTESIEVPTLRKGHSQWGNQLGQKEDWWEMQQLVCERPDKVRPVPTICAAACTPRPESCASWFRQRLRDGKSCLESGPRKGTTAGCEKTA